VILWVRQVYLDHNATTPVAGEVRRAIVRALKRTGGNASSLHTPGRAARGLVDQTRRAVAALLGCPPERVIFVSGGTEGNNAVIKGVFSQAGKGHIITSKIEHESVLGACQQVQAMGGRVTFLPAERDGRVRPEAVRAAIGPDTILISIMHANNETGVIQPIPEISAIAREAHIPLHTDAVQSFGKIRTDVDELGCEFLTLTAHKICGPKGTGAIYWRGGARWQPLVYGGDQEQQMRAGTEGVPQLAGLGRAAELAAATRESEFRRLRGLRARFADGLRKLKPDVRINEAPPEYQLPGSVNVTFPGVEGIRLLAGLDCYKVSVSIGSACTADRIEPSHVLLGMGLSDAEALSTIRFSMGRTTTAGDIRYVLAVLRKVLQADPPGLSYIDPQHITPERARSPETFLIDLRWPHERLLAPSVPGAREWTWIYFERYFPQIPWDREVILMCATGVFSYGAGYRLAKAGHPKVRVVYGGYSAWQGLHDRRAFGQPADPNPG